MMSDLPFIVSLPEQDAAEEVKGLFSSKGSQGVIALRSIPADRLRENLGSVCKSFAGVLKDIKVVGDFRLKEVTIQVEVTAEGGVEFIGTSKIGGKGAITLTFSEER